MNSIFTIFLTVSLLLGQAFAGEKKTNGQLLENIHQFAQQISNNEASLQDYQDLVSKIQAENSLTYESKVQIESHLLTAFKKSEDNKAAAEEISQALSLVTQGLNVQIPQLQSQSTSDSSLGSQLQPPISAQALPPTPYPTNLGFNYKDPLEFCDITSLAEQVLSTNYKDMNLQLRQRFKDKTLDELGELIIHQRAMEMASYATMASATALGTSVAAEYLPASLGGAARTGTLIGGRLTAVTGAAAASATLMYLDICSYAQQNARMIFQLTDLYDTGSIYTTDEKQKFAWQVLMYSMTGKVVQKFAIENTTTRNVGNLTKDVYYSVLSKGGNFFRGIFEQISAGMKSGAAQINEQFNPRMPNLPGTPVTPGTPSTTPPSALPRPEQPREIDIAKISPWSVLGVPTNGVLTYYSVENIGKAAVYFIKKEELNVYKLPLSNVYAQEAVFKVLVYAALAASQDSLEQKSIQNFQMRDFIEQTFLKLNPEQNLSSELYSKILSEMNEYNSAIPPEITSVFNEELNSVPAKRALIRLVIKMLYLDKSFDFKDRKILKTIQVQILGLQDPNFSDLIYRDIKSIGNQ